MNKRAKTYLRALLALTLLWTLSIVFYMPVVCAQEQKVWTQEEVDEARKGIEYNGEPEPEEPPAPEEPENPEAPEEKQESAFWKKVKDFFNSPGGKIVVLTVVIALLVFTVFKFINTRKVARDKKLSVLDPSTLADIEENVLESDIDRFLRQAIEAGNYKLAIRLMYLRLLQQLHEADLIVWKKEKTNRDYVRELRKHGQSRTFSDLTLAYEIVWYGDTDVSREKYEILATAFSTYKVNLNGKGRK